MLLGTENLRTFRFLIIGLVVAVFWVYELFEHFVIPPTTRPAFFIELVLITSFLGLTLYYLCGVLINVFNRLDESHRNLIRLQNYQASILESSPYAIVAIDKARRVTSFNRQAESISGYRTEDVIGKDGLSLFGDRTGISRALEAARSSNRVETIEETVLRTKHGTRVPSSLLLRRITSKDDRSDGFVLIVEDLREKKRLEKRLVVSEKMAAVSQLAAGLAHATRNPLASIGVNLRNLEDQFSKENGVDATHEKYLSMISSEVRRLNRLVDNFMRSAIPKRVNSKTGFCRLSEVLNAALERCQLLFEERSTRLCVNSPTNDMFIRCDSEPLTQAFSNILQNAAEAMPVAGELTVNIGREGEWGRISVRDRGCGISREKLERVFDFYFTTKAEGLGIGLPFSSLVIEQLGGKIEIESEVDRGTCVTVWLPLQSAESE